MLSFFTESVWFWFGLACVTGVGGAVGEEWFERRARVREVERLKERVRVGLRSGVVWEIGEPTRVERRGRAGLVEMVHVDVQGSAWSTLDAFYLVWEPKGWVMVGTERPGVVRSEWPALDRWESMRG